MFITKLKTAIVAMLAVCAMGYGAWAGVGDGGETPQASSAAQAPRKLTRNEPADHSAADVPTALVPLQGQWKIVSLTDDTSKPEKPASKEEAVKSLMQLKGLGIITIRGSMLSMPYQGTGGSRKTRDYRIGVDDTQQPKAINLIASGLPVGRGIYEFTAPATSCVQCHQLNGHGTGLLGLKPPASVMDICGPGLKKTGNENNKIGLRLAIALEGGRPTKFGGKGVLVFNLERIGEPENEAARLKREIAQIEQLLETSNASREPIEKLKARLQLLKAQQDEASAQARLRQSEAELERARAVVELAKVDLEVAQSIYKTAQASLAAIEKHTGKVPTTANPGSKSTCTILIRTLNAGESTRWVMTDEVKTVLEGLALAASELPLKPGSVDVWLVRGSKIMPIDYAAIASKADFKTNYSLQNGDRLFIQAKVGR